MAFSFYDITPHFRACVNSCLKHTGPANTRMDICRTRIFWRGYHTRCTWPRDDQIHLVFCWLKYITVLRIFQSRILHIFVAFSLSISAVFLPKACLNLLFCPLICPLNLPETQYFKLIDIMHNKLEGLQLLPDFCHWIWYQMKLCKNARRCASFFHVILPRDIKAANRMVCRSGGAIRI